MRARDRLVGHGASARLCDVVETTISRVSATDVVAAGRAPGYQLTASPARERVRRFARTTWRIDARLYRADDVTVIRAAAPRPGCRRDRVCGSPDRPPRQQTLRVRGHDAGVRRRSSRADAILRQQSRRPAADDTTRRKGVYKRRSEKENENRDPEDVCHRGGRGVRGRMGLEAGLWGGWGGGVRG